MPSASLASLRARVAPLSVLLGLVLSFGLSSAAAAEPLLSPRVRLLLDGRLRPELLSAPDAPSGAGRALLTARVTGSCETLRQAGLDARPLTGRICALRVSAAETRKLAGLPGVLAVEERRLLGPTLDRSAAAIGAPAARVAFDVRGRGVLVGVVDTGIDLRHQDFRHPDGHTRVAALLDLAQPADARHAELGDFGGAIWLKDELDAALDAEAAGRISTLPLTERDTNGHGTHVAGITAASGRATGRELPAGRYVGIAPEAELLIAQGTKGEGGSFTDVDVLTACRFIVERAAALGRPLVLNLSLGGAGGAHDGSTHLEQALDELFPPEAVGRSLVVAAGNDGARDHHAGAWRLHGEQRIPIELPATAAGMGQLAIELWSRGPVQLSLEDPDGHRVGPVGPDTTGDGTELPAGRMLIDNRGQPRADGLRSAAVVVVGARGGSPKKGTWILRIAGDAPRWDAWILESPPGTSARFTDRIAEDDRLSLPAGAHQAIVVGAYTSRNGWTNVAGAEIQRSTIVGDPSVFSASGPTADGRFAPDLSAPGEFIISALSADALPSSPSSAFFVGADDAAFAWADDGVHGVLRGTSQASPHVAGAVALLFEAAPTLTVRQVREILRVTASPVGPGFSPREGFGRLDVGAALAWVRGARGQSPSPAASQVGVNRDALPPDEELLVTLTPRDRDGAPLGGGHQVSIVAGAAPAVGPVEDLGEGRYERRFITRVPRGTVLQVSASVDGVPLDAQPQVHVVIDRSEIGRPFVLKGGCAAARPAARPDAGLALSGAVVLALGLLLGLAILRARWAGRRGDPATRR